MAHGAAPPSPATTAALTALAMSAFAANSLLCRAALLDTDIDAASFTSLRMLAGTALLLALAGRAPAGSRPAGSWRSATALCVYAVAFSFAYRELAAGTGALLLFGAVQVTMIGHGIRRGDRLSTKQGLGLAVAIAGLVALLLPGLTAPPAVGAVLMITAGIGWGAYSLRGRNTADPTRATAGNFLRALPLALAVSCANAAHFRFDGLGCAYAVASGAIASGVGYVIWYRALRGLRPTSAATIQLSVPVITALAGTLWLGEALTLRLLVAGAAILGGIALVLRSR